MAVIFEGNSLVVHELDGNTDYAVVTFSPADQCHVATEEFFAQRPLEALGIRSIGVTTKHVLWFISDEIDAVINLINEKLRNVSNIVIIGYSMGAYPALKWSRRLRATSVFSMAPKYSLDRDICHVEDHYIEKYYKPEMKGMLIDADELGGRLFIAYDPAHQHDACHAELIKEKFPGHDITLIKSFYSDHFIPRAVTGRQKFRRLLDALSKGTHQDVCRTFSQERRRSLNNVTNLLHRNIDNNPLRALQVLLSASVFGYDNLKKILGNTWDIARLAHRLSARNHMNEAALCMRLPYLFARYGKDLEKAIIDRSRLQKFHAGPVGYHGHLLCYDLVSKSLSGRELSQSSFTCPEVRIEPVGDATLLRITTGREEAYLYEEEGAVLVSDQRRESGFVLEKSERNEHYHIRSRFGYLTSLPDGRYEIDRQVKLEWEEFFLPA